MCRHVLSIYLLIYVLGLHLAALPVIPQAGAQVTLTTVDPMALAPGKSTRITVRGTQLSAPLRVWTSCASKAQVQSVEGTQAVIDIELPGNSALGPIGLSIATPDGPSEMQTLLVDDLPSLADNGANHTLASAQVVPVGCGIDGTSDAAESDFFRFSVTAGQRVGFEVHAQRIGTGMDSVIRLLAADGKQVVTFDDDDLGPDCRFRHEFVAGGDYILEIHDSRFAAGGRYRLRVGDFPIVDYPFPLGGRKGSKATFKFAGADGASTPQCEIDVPITPWLTFMPVQARFAEGQSSSWASIVAYDFPVVVEEDTDNGNVNATDANIPDARADKQPLTYPLGISGCLRKPGEVDSYLLAGVKGQTLHVSSRTRSLGSSALLQMQLYSPSNAKVIEAEVTDKDEWGFGYTLEEDGTYRLEVADLLNRGGPEFGYWIEVNRPNPFTVTLLSDAKTKNAFSVDEGIGACVLDLTIERHSYEGSIELSLLEETPSLRLLNPLIPPAAKEARIYLVPTATWSHESQAVIRLVAKSTAEPLYESLVTSDGLRRLKAPHVMFPAAWGDGLLTLAGVTPRAAFFELQPADAIIFARPLQTNSAKLQLKRIDAEFKEGIRLLGDTLPAQWSLTSSAEGDSYAAEFTRSKEAAEEPDQISLMAYGEFRNQGRISTIELPVTWVDPIRVSLEPQGPLVAGMKSRVRAVIKREGGDPQPVVLTWKDLPAGITGAEKVDVTAEQGEADLELDASFDVTSVSGSTLSLQATSSFHGHEFSVASNIATVASIATPQRLEIFPPDIVLSHSDDRRQLAITGFDPHNAPRDWTRASRIRSTDIAVAEVRDGIVYARGNGVAELVIEIGSLRQAVPIRVEHFEVRRPVQFENDVLAALSKQGCNSGACHGSPSGKGGFCLSLRGFDSELDRRTLIREAFGRRVNVVEPERSLLLAKPLMKVPHGGGMRLHPNDAAFSILTDWIAEGAKASLADTPKCLKLELFPNTKWVLNRYSGGQQLSVIAHFADGSKRDVTHLAVYESSNNSVATVSPLGFVASRDRGESVILVRYLEHVDSIPFMFVEDVPGFSWRSTPTKNVIDELVQEKLLQLQFEPAPPCTESEFLRRVYLDVIGLLPTVEETIAFLTDPDAEKRERVIERLLERPEYAKFWALQWGDLLRATSKSVGDDGVYKYHRWVEEAIRSNMRYDEFARKLLTASGSTLVHPPANFYRTASDTNDCVESISQVFLGARLQCAKCHNHPYERWTQDNYYGLAAFFNRLQRRKTQRPGEMFVWTSTSGEVTQPRTEEVMKPWLPGGDGSLPMEDTEDRRKTFAAWLIRPENPYFAKVEANRIWSRLFARGIVHPIDDFRDSNPPSNEPLLAALAKSFVETGYDRKQLLKSILASRTYQASFQTNDFNHKDTLYFSHQVPRRLGAEQLLDAVNSLMATDQTFGNLPAGTHATQLPAPDVAKVDFLKVLGQPERATVCACERAIESNMGMAIELFNGRLVREKLRAPNNRFRTAIAAGKTPSEAIQELYLAGVCRSPSDAELATALAHCVSSADQPAALEDVCWALLNTDEFLFQH